LAAASQGQDAYGDCNVALGSRAFLRSDRDIKLDELRSVPFRAVEEALLYGELSLGRKMKVHLCSVLGCPILGILDALDDLHERFGDEFLPVSRAFAEGFVVSGWAGGGSVRVESGPRRAQSRAQNQ
jgi:hypothetical protein